MKRDQLYLILILLITNISILMNIPFLREALPFVLIVIIGYLFVLNIGIIDSLKTMDTLLVSVGSGIAIYIFTNLFLNTFNAFYKKPLSLLPVLLLINAEIILLAFLARKKPFFKFHTLDYYLKNEKILVPLIFSFTLPFFAVLSLYLMELYRNSIFTNITMIMIILFTISLITVFRDRISSTTYSVSLLNISLALVLMISFYSRNIFVFNDATLEYYVATLTYQIGHWSISNYYNAYNSCMVITIFPATYSILSGLPLNDVLKIMQVLIFLLPLTVFSTFRKYGDKRGFIAAIFFISQQPFFWDMPTHLRTAFATFFMALAFMILLNDEITGWKKTLLFMLFSLSIIFAHYSTAYLAFLILIFSSIMKIFRSREIQKSSLTLTFSLLFFAVLFFWFGQVTNVPFKDGIIFFKNTFSNLTNFFISDYRGGTALKAFGIGIRYPAQYMRVLIYYSSTALIIIGFIYVFRKRFDEVDGDLIYLSITGISLMIISLVIPYVTKGYDIERLYFAVLLLLSIFLVFGAEFIAKYASLLSRRLTEIRVRYFILSSIIFLQFIAGSSLVYSLGGVPQMAFPEFAEDSSLGAGTVYTSDIHGVAWLTEHGDKNRTILFDNIGDHKFLFSGYSIINCFNVTHFQLGFFNRQIYELKTFRILNYTSRPSMDGYYGCLFQYNVRNKVIVKDSSLTNTMPIESMSIINTSAFVYDNGNVKILSGSNL